MSREPRRLESLRLTPDHAEIGAVRFVELEGRDPTEAIAERVHERALAEGLVRGMNLAVERGATVLDDAAERLDQEREKLTAELAHSAVDLAVNIARQLVRAEIANGNHDIEKIVRETLEAASVGRGHCTVHVHPEDFEVLRRASFRTGTSLQADIGVTRGDVHVDTSMGLMVREIEESLSSIAARLREELQ